jgi:hypothetical protein
LEGPFSATGASKCGPCSVDSTISMCGSDCGKDTEAIGTDAGQGFHLKPPYPCHYYMHGCGRFGLQCLTNLDLLPPTGAVVIAAPLKIKEGSGSPLRVLALVSSSNSTPGQRVANAKKHVRKKRGKTNKVMRKKR